MLRVDFKRKIYFISLFAIIILGIFLRLKGFLSNSSLWHDECALAWNIKFKSYSELFGIMRFLQVAPPFFLFFSKFLTQIFGYSEKVFRFIPFMAGCLSLIAFYFLSKQALRKNLSVIIAVFLFAISPFLINYSFEFKPYEVDVFLTIICLLFFTGLDLDKISEKKALLIGFIASIIPWFSFVSVFSISGGLLYFFLKDYRSNLRKKILLTLPLLISCLLYIRLYLLPNYIGTHFKTDWQSYFVTLNPIHFFSLIIESIRYLFFPFKYVAFALILIIWGIVLFLREKEKPLFFNIASLTFILFILSSLFHMYPFAKRVILFLLPIYIIFMTKPLDIIAIKNKISSAIILFLISSVIYAQSTFSYGVLKSKNISKGESPREMLEVLNTIIKPGDIIFVNYASNTEFEYYFSFFNFKNKVIQERVSLQGKNKYIEFLNSLGKGYYWFYLPYDSDNVPVFPYILDWIKDKEVLYKAKKDNSLLLYIHIK